MAAGENQRGTSASNEAFYAAVNLFLDSLERGEADFGVIGPFIHPDCEFNSAITREIQGGSIHGREAIFEWFADLVSTMELRYEDRRFEAIGDDTILLLATNFLRGKGSGAEIARELGIVYEMEEGMIRRAVNYASHAAARAALEQEGPA